MSTNATEAQSLNDGGSNDAENDDTAAATAVNPLATEIARYAPYARSDAPHGGENR